jgi:histidinol-phosphate/aromatic aminotransferase/cobyric acid decarboxylase-like protein
MPPGEHGGDAARLERELGLATDSLLDLSVNLNPFAPDPAPIVARHLDALSRYPDTTAATEALAEAIGVDRERVLLTNGGAEAIALVAAHLGRGRVDEPEFSLYRRHLHRVDPAAGALRSNPNNPTGLLAADDDRAAMWDEAFYGLATGRWTRGDADRGAFVVGSLTKVLACPGLRVGYLIAPDDSSLPAIRRRQPEWSVTALAADALPELLAGVDLPAWAAAIASARAELVAVLAAHGLHALPSDASWVLVPAPGLREVLVPNGVVVRDCRNFGLDGVVRLAVAGPGGLERLDRALRDAGAGELGPRPCR